MLSARGVLPLGDMRSVRAASAAVNRTLQHLGSLEGDAGFSYLRKFRALKKKHRGSTYNMSGEKARPNSPKTLRGCKQNGYVKISDSQVSVLRVLDERHA